MNRRSFIKIMGTGAVVVAATPIVVGQFSKENTADLRPSLSQPNILKTLISYAMLCPNPHNKQPWKVELASANTVRLYVDEERLLPETDPIHRQIHIGQGTFIESMVVAASHFGLRGKVNYFPMGEYSNTTIEALPVADIQFFEDPTIQQDPLFVHLVTRQSNKTPYQLDKLTEEQKSAILSLAVGTDYGLQMVEDEQGCSSMASYLVKAMEIEESNTNRSLETIAMFRFNDDEVKKYRDGFGLAQNGVTGIKKALVETFIVSRDQAEANPAAFGKEGVKSVKNVVANNQHYAMLSSTDNSRTTQVEIGRLYSRINLIVTSLGLAQHPMSQILQEYDDMLAIQKEFKQRFDVPESHTVQMLFRLGVAASTPPSPRRAVNDILV